MNPHQIAFDTALSFHIAAGSAGLILGPIAMFAPKRKGVHTRTGEVYYYLFVVLFISALALALIDFSRAWWLALVGAFSYYFARKGYRAAKERGPGWLIRHVSGQGGSYIAMVTALIVVNTQSISTGGSPLFLVPWFLPTIVGSPIITWVNFQIASGHRPKAWRGRQQLAGA
jgi:uncharacterized membrane protein